MKIYTGFIVLLFVYPCFAQKPELPKGENGKYIYYEVVEESAIPSDSLIRRAGSFASLAKMKIDSQTDTSISANGKFIINRSLSAISHPAGEIQYLFTVEIKNNKYRYWLTNFKYIEYIRDRYGNFVPVNTMGVPLERSPEKRKASEWKAYIDATAVKSANFAGMLKKYMKEEPKTPQKSVPVSIKW